MISKKFGMKIVFTLLLLMSQNNLCEEYHESKVFKFDDAYIINIESNDDIFIEKQFENLKGDKMIFVVNENEK